MKKELPSGIGTIFSLGPENSGFNGATPTHKTHKMDEFRTQSIWLMFLLTVTLTLQSLDGSQLLVLLPVILFVLRAKM